MSAIKSMTGFGKGEASNAELTVTAEIKSVNHRFKDFRFRAPSAFNSLELDLKKTLTQKCSRGTFDISLYYKRAAESASSDQLDEAKIESFVSKVSSILSKSKQSFQYSPTDFLRSEFLKDQDDKNDEALHTLAKDAFSKAVDNLVESRQSEGSKLFDVLTKHKEAYQSHFKEIEKNANEYQKGVEAKLRARLEEYKSEIKVDDSRFMQEVVFYLEKLDVHEEINRIEAHLKKLSQVLESNGEIGRELEFLLQELNRETNTIGSKSNSEVISDKVVQMKVQLEKMREQALNLE